MVCGSGRGEKRKGGRRMKIKASWAVRMMLSLGVMVLLALPTQAAHAGKVDPFWKVQKEMMKMDVSSGKAAPGALLIEVFIKSSDVEKTKGRVEAFGGSVRTIVGDIMTASLPEKAILDAESWDEVEYIEAAKPLKPRNDLANASTQVAAVQAGTGLTHGYDGSGVIVGVIDSGIDLTHPAFFDGDGESRVLYLWDQTDATGPGPSEMSSTYGTEYKHAAIRAGGISQVDTSGHGTHVAGTAAGRDSTYPGVAPEAGLVIVKTNFTSTGLTDAASYIFQKAALLGRPAVINASLGGHIGPHDGTSLEEQALDSLVSNSAGRSMVVSAGNEGDTVFNGYTGGIHTGFSVAGGGAGLTYFQAIPSTQSQIDLWGLQDCTANLGIGIYKSGVGIIAATEFVANGVAYTKNLSDGAILLAMVAIDRTEMVNAQNGKWHSLIAVAATSSYDPSVYEMILAVEDACSSFDAWVATDGTMFFSDYSGADVYPGGNGKTVGIPGTASKAITVGAYITRTSWTDIGGNPQSDPLGLITTLDDLAYFSSRGPALTAAQGQKPNVTAPGAFTISAYSSASSPDSRYVIDSQHVAMPGTSMSSPHVAGIVALLLQAYPSLSYDQVMTYLQSTARSDSFVGSAPNSNWGYGKVDALAAINAVVTDYPPGAGDGDYSGIAVTGITDGATDVPDTTQDFAITFPRDSDSATCTTGEIFVVPASIPASASITPTKGAWDATICGAGSALPASLSMADARNGTLSLNSQLGQGTFAFCVSKNVRDSESIRFGGKTVTFTTTSGGGGGGGCYLAAAAGMSPTGGLSLAFVVSSIAVVMVRRRMH